MGTQSIPCPTAASATVGQSVPQLPVPTGTSLGQPLPKWGTPHLGLSLLSEAAPAFQLLLPYFCPSVSLFEEFRFGRRGGRWGESLSSRTSCASVGSHKRLKYGSVLQCVHTHARTPPAAAAGGKTRWGNTLPLIVLHLREGED